MPSNLELFFPSKIGTQECENHHAGAASGRGKEASGDAF